MKASIARKDRTSIGVKSVNYSKLNTVLKYDVLIYKSFTYFKSCGYLNYGIF